MTTDMLLYSSRSHGNVDCTSIRTERTERNTMPIEMETNAEINILV